MGMVMHIQCPLPVSEHYYLTPTSSYYHYPPSRTLALTNNTLLNIVYIAVTYHLAPHLIVWRRGWSLLAPREVSFLHSSPQPVDVNSAAILSIVCGNPVTKFSSLFKAGSLPSSISLPLTSESAIVHAYPATSLAKLYPKTPDTNCYNCRPHRSRDTTPSNHRARQDTQGPYLQLPQPLP
ncbi:hypothetical protein E2C01_063463 [Portunus trituberculatus]|uniref:Uncharacterized protein n=1 Tax=Portunus trituberculatus TaxID=210409 RepID=A0A5B7HH40_PORTR|nr:hypothetical protein [Portunus trituberculatus]